MSLGSKNDHNKYVCLGRNRLPDFRDATDSTADASLLHEGGSDVLELVRCATNLGLRREMSTELRSRTKNRRCMGSARMFLFVFSCSLLVPERELSTQVR